MPEFFRLSSRHTENRLTMCARDARKLIGLGMGDNFNDLKSCLREMGYARKEIETAIGRLFRHRIIEVRAVGLVDHKPEVDL